MSARSVREYCRAVMLEPVLRRLFDIGMGVERFETPTMAGNVVTIPAPAVVQVRALVAIRDVGVPQAIGLVDGGGGELPGVIALAPLELDEARRAAQGERYIAPPVPIAAQDDGQPSLTPGMAARIEQGEFEIVEIDEGESANPQAMGDDSAAPEPPPAVDNATLEAQILARRRARRGRGNGSIRPNGA